MGQWRERRKQLDVLAPGLVALVAAASSESLTRAAFALRMSPSTLSRQIANLQGEVGVALFTRAGRGVQLTPSGRRLVAEARRSLDSLTVVLDDLASEESPSATPRLGLIRTLGTELIPRALAGFRSAHGGHSVALLQATTVELQDALVDDRLDLALVTPMRRPTWLTSVEVLRQPLELLVPIEHRFAGLSSISFADLDGVDVVLLRPEAGMRAVFDRLVDKFGTEPQLVLETDDIDMARGLAAEGLGLAIGPRLGEDHRADVVAVPFRDGEASRSVHLAWHTERPLVPPVAALRDHLLVHLAADGLARQLPVKDAGRPGE